MDWLNNLFFDTGSAAQAALILALVIVVGLGLGAIRVFGVGLGVAGVLFAGLIFGHFRLGVNHEVMEFAREFGLILFVYTIGVQVGPGFLASLRKQGLPLNLMAAAIVLLGVATTVFVAFVFLSPAERPAALGLFSGATTNTPSLAAAQQALKDLPGAPGEAAQALPGLGYAVAYPFGILGILLTMLLVRTVFRVDLRREAEALARQHRRDEAHLATRNLEVRNPNIEGLPLSAVPTLDGSGIVVSRVLHGDETRVARGDTVLHGGDVLLAVGPEEALERLRVVVGEESPTDVRAAPGSAITTRRILVTRDQALNKTIPELDMGNRYGVIVTRINRGAVDLPVTLGVRLQFGDNLVVVGEAEAIERAAREVLGDSVKRLNHPQILPIFVGVALGVLLGSWPINLPGFPAPVKLGLAGGPLLVAIVLSRLGKVGPLVWYLPLSANMALREVGIALFLACVGLKSGDQFLATLAGGEGLRWMACGALITALPLLTVGLFAHLVLKLNYLYLCGLLAGSMTDPPALAFAGTLTNSEAPSVAYATVYPLVMLLRVLAAQAIALFLFR